ncbi:hypothetical protein B0A52_03056 [Exophiala mesophila]|uniref:D-xylose reductase [NAD(P)H] n=1 Tax=Exophiala mesophila TaxID=212818 RepID=A0A438NCT2_EXOME|nr:hypothetical protein B0A52_03056 [Exophiala mesophila]
MALNRSFKLNTGASIPAVGFGTWQAAPREVEEAVEIALKAGHRHIDCAAVYGNEAEVGAGIKASGVKREEIFITSKLWNTNHDSYVDVERALNTSLQDLGLEYLDLYLMHWPVAFAPGTIPFPLDSEGVLKLSNTCYTKTWQFMEDLLQTGKVKAIGVSNFNIRRLKKILDVCKVVPAVNQVEAHPYLQQPNLLAFCNEHGILIEAYSPLGNNVFGQPRVVDDELVHSIGKSLGMDPGQVLVSWAVQRGTIVLPKSVTKSRIISNFQDQVLPPQAFAALNGLERHKRYSFFPQWGFDTFDEFGAEKVKMVALDSGALNKTTCIV